MTKDIAALRAVFIVAATGAFIPMAAFAESDCDREDGAPPTMFNARVAPAGIASSGFLFFGSGNPPTGFAQQEDPATPLELDLSVIYRTGDTIQPAGATSCGEIIYRVPTGAQMVDPAHGVTTANPNRAAWNFNYAIVLGESAGTLQQFLERNALLIKIDLDPGPEVRSLTLHAVYDPVVNPKGSHIVWKTRHGQILFGDDGGTTQATENSENDAFWAALIGSDPQHLGYTFGPATFNVDLMAIAHSGRVLADIRGIIEVAPPAP
ncbi:MAG TPA: hypothetical protein VF502_00540 [Stellaceae bacterium]